MNTTSLHIQIESSIKKQAQKTASELGLSLSSVVKALLTQFVRTKQLSVGMREETPNAYLRQSLKQSEEDIKAGRTQAFESWDEAIDTSRAKLKMTNEPHIEFGPLFNKKRQSAPMTSRWSFSRLFNCSA